MKDYYVMDGEKLVSVWFVPPLLSDKDIIPKGVKIIGKECFKGTSSFKKIYIPEGVKVIESGAFYNNNSLEEVYLPESLRYVDDGAFARCKKLRYLKYGENTQFGKSCFSECSNLRWIESGGVKARTFYFVHANSFAITIEQSELSSNGKRVYLGRFSLGDHFPNGTFDMEVDPLYFVESMDGKHFWYSKELEECLTAVDYQMSHLSFKDYFHKDIIEKGTITPLEFSFLTGICYEGREGWNKLTNATDDTEFNLQDVIETLKVKFPKLQQRLLYALNHQDVYNPILSVDNGVILSEFRETL